MLAVSAWLKCALDVSWAWIALSIIRTIYKPSGSYWTTVNQVMQALFSAAIILLVEKIFLQFVAIDFHQKALSDRLTENRLGLRALDRLSSAEPKRRHGHSKSTGSFGGMASVENFSRKNSPTPMNVTTEPDPASGLANAEEADQVIQSVTHKVHSARPSARKNRHKKAVATLIGDAIGGAIGQVALKNSKLNRSGDMSGLHSARRLARKLFAALNNEREFLLVEDFYPYFRTREEASAAFLLFDKDGNGDISKREMREAVQRIYRERKSLVASMKDAGSAVSKLDFVCLGLCLMIFIFVCILIFTKDDTLTSLVPLATIIVGFSFIFGNSAATLFESLIFIFSTHVFDVGDLVMIDDQVLEVREFGMFSTVFRRTDGQEIIAPNSLLAGSKLIHNLRRSDSMWVTRSICAISLMVMFFSGGRQRTSKCLTILRWKSLKNSVVASGNTSTRTTASGPTWISTLTRWTSKTPYSSLWRWNVRSFNFLPCSLPFTPEQIAQTGKTGAGGGHAAASSCATSRRSWKS